MTSLCMAGIAAVANLIACVVSPNLFVRICFGIATFIWTITTAVRYIHELPMA